MIYFTNVSIQRRQRIAVFFYALSLLFECSNYLFRQQHASGKKFQEILEESFIQPLHIQGELYIGVPPGKFVEYSFPLDIIWVARYSDLLFLVDGVG